MSKSPRSRGAGLLWIALALVVVDALWIGLFAGRDARSRPFQRATSGIGLGPSVATAWSFFGIDPRTQARCENEEWPVPGLPCPNPYHGTTVLDAAPLDRASTR
ncbi:MAG: hypothetical protein GY711_12585 [bacterium]|nr:hypothetical protein [bacterium]